MSYLFTTVIGKLYKFTGYAKKVSASGGYRIWIGTSQTGSNYQAVGASQTEWTKYTCYFVPFTTSTYIMLQTLSSTAGEYNLFDKISVKEVTNVGTDGVLLYSEATLDTQSLKYAQAGIDYNLINSFEVFLAWEFGTGWLPTTEKATKTAGTASDLTQSIAITAGKKYQVTVTVSGRTAGSVTPDVGGTNGTARSTNDTFTEFITCGSTDTNIRFEADATFNGSIDNISVKEFTQPMIIN